MKFKRGVKVEVMNQAEVPISWRAAQILSEDEHTYMLRFDSLGESESVVERVYKSLIRPSPPLVRHTENWLPGDILEVFDDFSWKVAIVVHAVNEDYYFVRLMGSSHEFCIHISSMRRRLAWQDGRWDWMSKGSAEYRKLKSHKLSNQICYRNAAYQLSRPDSVDRLEEFHVPSSRSLKRTYVHCSSTTESHSPHFKKQRTLETDGQRQEILEKVEAIASYPRETLGKTIGHASFNIRLTRYNKMENSCISPLRGSELDDSDSDDSCSVGSCSVTSEGAVKFPCHRVPDFICSDAESVCYSGDEDESVSHPHPPEEDLAESIHRLELHAYHCTLEALFASGPLTWEQETMLTNLRITLHISNDEHLMELKNLISAKSCNYYTR